MKWLMWVNDRFKIYTEIITEVQLAIFCSNIFREYKFQFDDYDLRSAGGCI